MRDPVLRSFGSLPSCGESWYQRVRENFRQLMAADGFLPSSANGAPIHLAQVGKSGRSGRAAGASLLTHAAIVGLVAVLIARPPLTSKDSKDTKDVFKPTAVPRDLLNLLRSMSPSDGHGRGAGNKMLPPTAAPWPPISSIQIIKPTIPEKRERELPVPPTIFDEKSPPVLPPVHDIGEPWRKDVTNSTGIGGGDTIGTKKGSSVGESDKDGIAGRGDSLNPYRAGVTAPSCAYCPDPQYTDEAREAKLQGAVMLEVLVGSDGRASQIRVTKGLGLGLEERSIQAIRGWRFVPARDASRRAVPAWITIEAVFRLF